MRAVQVCHVCVYGGCESGVCAGVPYMCRESVLMVCECADV